MIDINIKLIENNIGQISSVKCNPRDLTDAGFDLAKQSIKDFPEMLDVRRLVVVKHNDKYVVIGGNQRLRALIALDYKTAPCFVVDWSADKINEFIIKDNLEYGQWSFELLANEWEVEQLVEWGLDLPVDFDAEIKEKKDLSDEIKTEFKLEVDCKNELSLGKLYQELTERGLECRILTL